MQQNKYVVQRKEDKTIAYRFLFEDVSNVHSQTKI